MTELIPGKIALCFMISYEHVLHKEHLWKEWIQPNIDIINVYFHFKEKQKIRSTWIRQYCLPSSFIKETSYYHMIPAYLSLLRYAVNHDNQRNQWFCFLTESCCPIVSPKHFRETFLKDYDKSILRTDRPTWNANFQKRANLRFLPEYLRLVNDPYFILARRHVISLLRFVHEQRKISLLVCNGGLANESLFAIIFKMDDTIRNDTDKIICQTTHMTDWSRMSSATSPYVFTFPGSKRDIAFIESSLRLNNRCFFVRKVASNYPDNVLKQYCT